MFQFKRVNSAYWALRVGLGAAAFLAGLDKFFNLLTNWSHYLSPAMASMLPVSTATFMHAVGVIEMIVGLAILAGLTRIGAYVAGVWLLAIAGNLALSGYFDVAVRDVEMAIGAYTLARLAELREEAIAARPASLADSVRRDPRRATA